MLCTGLLVSVTNDNRKIARRTSSRQGGPTALSIGWYPNRSIYTRGFIKKKEKKSLDRRLKALVLLSLQQRAKKIKTSNKAFIGLENTDDQSDTINSSSNPLVGRPFISQRFIYIFLSLGIEFPFLSTSLCLPAKRPFTPLFGSVRPLTIAHIYPVFICQQYLATFTLSAILTSFRRGRKASIRKENKIGRDL